MTPAARYAAAIDVLDHVLAGEAAEKALTGWARRSRFAGSKDRAAVRDLVFDALRNLRSFAVLGRAMTGRGVILGAVRSAQIPEQDVFSGLGHAPPPLTQAESVTPLPSDDPGDNWNLPDWLVPVFQNDLGGDAARVAALLGRRAPTTLRVNLRKTSVKAAQAALADAGISAQPNPVSPTALTVAAGTRNLKSSPLFLDGAIELQDASSQAVVDSLPLRDGQRVLDYCAGGGGKTLAMAARADLILSAYDADAGRMRDLPARAQRAGVAVDILTDPPDPAQRQYDLVLCDVPCSGSGTWRRAPQAKWDFTLDRLQELNRIQDDILDRASALVAPGGMIAYATCSLFRAENGDRVDAFLGRHSGWTCRAVHDFAIGEDADCLFVAHLTR